MRKSIILGAILLASTQFLSAQNYKTGYYKDLFIDSSVGVDCYSDLPAAKLLGLRVENLTTHDQDGEIDSATVYEKMLTKSLMVGSEIDENGVLLYPDGSPRFRILYIIGGSATTHGGVLTETGLNNIRTFYNNGGSYIGTCAGAFICSKAVIDPETGVIIEKPQYLGIWPGYTSETRLHTAYTPVALGKKSPILRYYDFGGDKLIDSVRHNGGCFMNTKDIPAGTEIVGRFVTPQIRPDLDGKVNAWAYKASEQSGRLVVTGSHPERMITGERLEMYTAMLRYALDGNGAPRIKGELVSGEERWMVKKTSENQPDYARIGDRQYHHFYINVPKGAKKVTVDLTPGQGAAKFDLELYAAIDGPAFNTNAKWYNVDAGANKSLVIDAPKAGKLYISVYCDTTVETYQTKCGPQYCGRTEVLNGVPYMIKATVSNK